MEFILIFFAVAAIVISAIMFVVIAVFGRFFPLALLVLTAGLLISIFADAEGCARGTDCESLGDALAPLLKAGTLLAWIVVSGLFLAFNIRSRV
ncbi:MAG: hypothetical protein ACT4OU_02205 [Hyphomicrobium sp.]